jgi:hypothetical protein
LFCSGAELSKFWPDSALSAGAEADWFGVPWHPQKKSKPQAVKYKIIFDFIG